MTEIEYQEFVLSGFFDVFRKNFKFFCRTPL